MTLGNLNSLRYSVESCVSSGLTITVAGCCSASVNATELKDRMQI